MDHRLGAMAAIAVLALGAGGAARAQDLPGIQMPSHNVYCMASPALEGQPTPQLRCDIREMTNSPPQAPASCPLSYGDSYYIEPTGGAHLTCHGDTVADPSYPVLEYGQTWNAYGFTCLSQPTGIVCHNGQGHGFTLARASQHTF